jgi:naphthoate synthase
LNSYYVVDEGATFEDIEDVVADSAAMVTINWSERYRVLRAKTVEEMIQAFRVAWADRQVH